VPFRERPIPAKYGRANPLWTKAAIFTAILALGIGAWAVVNQYLASRPVGEGELFAEEVTGALEAYQDSIAADTDVGIAVRHLRNVLGVVAVSVVDSDASYIASTSQNLTGSELGGFLANALS